MKAAAPPGGPHGNGTAGRQPAAAALTVVRGAVREPLTRRTRREVLFCLTGIPFGLANPVVGFYLTALLLWRATPSRPPNPSWLDGLAALIVAGLLVLLLAAGAARPLGAACRRLAARLLGERIAPPPPARRWHGTPAGLAGRLRDGPGWRATAYLLLKLPVMLVECYAVVVSSSRSS